MKNASKQPKNGQNAGIAHLESPGGANLVCYSWPLDRFQAYAHNPRRHDHQIHKLAAVIREFGFKVPVLVRSTGEVIDGHFRLKAAAAAGLAEVPVIVCDEWTDAQVKAFRLLVNKSTEWAEWDTAALTVELVELRELEFNADLIDLSGLAILPAVETPDEPTSVRRESAAPEEFKEYDEDIPTDHACPKCGYRWAEGE